jgi:hypothetical protein
MIRAARKVALAVAAALATLAVAGTAGALDPATEAAAKAALKHASEKYLAADFASAAGVLRKAARACGGARCSVTTKAALLRDLGIMQFRQGDKAAAQKAFGDALALEPGLALGAAYDAPDVRAAFDAAKGGGEAIDAPPAGDFTHTPPAEQKANTPLPVYAEVSGTAVARARVRYKGEGMNDWARVDMKRVGQGWGALIPCGAVTVGTMRYWIQGLDADGDAAAGSGDVNHPFEVPIRSEIASEAPHLPGRAPPHSCEEGETPAENAIERSTPTAATGEAEARETERRAPGGPSTYARWWVGVAGAIDFLSLPAGNDVCTLNSGAAPANASGYYCTNPDGSDFPSRSSPAQNAALVQGQAGQVGGGVHPGDLRALIAVDYAVSPQVLIGGRLGYVLNAYPSGGAAVSEHHAFGPRIHVEGRGTYVFGDAPLTHEGFAPTVFLSLGAAEFDGHVVSIVSTNQKSSSVPISQPVEVWLTSGPLFVAAGGGARYQFSGRAAFDAALRMNVAFGGVGPLLTFGPEIAFQYGF